MDELIQNTWGWVSGGVIWAIDHSSALMALTLFVMQVIYQVYRIRKARKDCQIDDTKGGTE